MGFLHLVEDRPTPSAVYNRRVYTSAAAAASAAVMIGYDSAFIGGAVALPSFSSEFGFDKLSPAERDLLSANVVSCYQAGAFFGALLAYPCGHGLGRKRGLALSAALVVLGAAMMLGASTARGLGFIYVGRVLAGLGVGVASSLSPMYCAELAPPAIRGRLVGLYEMAWQVGGLAGFWINYVVARSLDSRAQWLVPFAVQLVPASVFFVAVLFVDESPRWLFSRGRRHQGVAVLARVRNLPADHVYVRQEMAAMDAAVDRQRRTVGTGLWQPVRFVLGSAGLRRRFLLGGSLFMWQNATGINAVNYYSPTVFRSMGVAGTDAPLLTTGVFGVVKTVVTLVWLFYLIDHVGRRPLMMYGAVAGSACLWYVAAYIKVADPHPAAADAPMTAGAKSAVAFFYLWTACYTPSWNGTPWVVNSEMFDQTVREPAQAFAASCNWLFNFLVARFTPQMFTAMGYGVYMFFASLMLLAAVYVYFLVPETKGIPLEAMDALFASRLPARAAHGVVLSQIQEADQEADRQADQDLSRHVSTTKKVMAVEDVGVGPV